MAISPRAAGFDDAYRDWAPFYPAIAHNALMRVEEEAMRSLLPDVQGASVLDAGCGTGRYARAALERGATLAIGVDRSGAMLYNAATVRHRIHADFAALPLPPVSMNVIIAGLALMDVADLGAVFSEWSRVLRPSGVVLCSLLHPRGKALGWTRTYDTPAGRGCLPAHWHSRQDIAVACERALLQIDAIAEPGLDDSPSEPVALIVRARGRC